MPTNKNAQLRYQALDRCLSNWSRRYYIEDLVAACNEALYLYNGLPRGEVGVRKRQVQEDLKFIQSEEGYGMLIDAIQDGRRKYYRYHRRHDTINKQPINQEEMDLVHDALLLLQRFDGIPQFEWLDNLEKRLYTTSKLGRNRNTAVSFQHNPSLKGMDRFYKPLFHAIVTQRVLDIKYHPFGKEVRQITVTPYHLKQYNNRWFLIGKHDASDYFSNFAIDRIEEIHETSKPYQPVDVDFEDYFKDVIGVSVTQNPVETIELKVSGSAINYLITKPLHESQTVSPEALEDGSWKVTLRVQNNYELRAVLLSFGSQIEVLAPQTLREMMQEEGRRIYHLYHED